MYIYIYIHICTSMPICACLTGISSHMYKYLHTHIYIYFFFLSSVRRRDAARRCGCSGLGASGRIKPPTCAHISTPYESPWAEVTVMCGVYLRTVEILDILQIVLHVTQIQCSAAEPYGSRED